MFILPVASKSDTLSASTLSALRTVDAAPALTEVFWYLLSSTGEIVKVDASGRGILPGGSFEFPAVVYKNSTDRYVWTDNGKRAQLGPYGRTMVSLTGEFMSQESSARIAALIGETLFAAAV